MLSGGAHQREYKANGEHIEHIRRFLFGKLRHAPIEQRHEEDATEQAHIAEISGFKQREHLHAENTKNRVQHGKEQHRKPAQMQPLAAAVKPIDVEQRPAAEQQNKRVVREPSEQSHV